MPRSYPHFISLCARFTQAIMICNNSGQVSAEWAAQWSLVDIDWNSDKVDWSKPKPMNAEVSRCDRPRGDNAHCWCWVWLMPLLYSWVYWL
jgi:hypothetical protein